MAGSLLLLLVCVCACVTGRQNHHRGRTGIDAILFARCKATCLLPTSEKKNCESECLLGRHEKPGECNSLGNMSAFDKACLQECTYDVECHSVLKCCTNSCSGRTCQTPVKLDTAPGLPDVPDNILLKKRRSGRSMLVEWETIKAAAETTPADLGPIVYVIEERLHVGKMFKPSIFGEWYFRQRTTKPKVTLKNIVPGHWYQIRIAAVNANGTRGFSEPSSPFTPDRRPFPPHEPKNLTVTKLGWVNNTLWGELHWKPSESDIPIQRYKIFWSRRVQPESKQASVLVHHSAVPHDKTSFVLKWLEPESLYFLQVQALSQFGRERLKSTKAATFLNTADHKNATADWSSHTRSKSASQISDVRVLRFYWTDDQLHAQISWRTPHVTSRYSVSWIPHSSCKVIFRPESTATTENAHYDIYGLKFKCKYQVTVKDISHSSVRAGRVSFTTPNCNQVSGTTSC